MQICYFLRCCDLYLKSTNSVQNSVSFKIFLGLLRNVKKKQQIRKLTVEITLIMQSSQLTYSLRNLLRLKTVRLPPFYQEISTCYANFVCKCRLKFCPILRKCSKSSRLLPIFFSLGLEVCRHYFC